MKIQTIISLTAAVLFLGQALLASADALKENQAAAAGIKSIKAGFVQEKHMSFLQKPLVSKGIFYFQSPDSLRWEYETPFQSILLMHGGEVRRFVKGEKGLTEETGGGLQAMQIGLQQMTQWLKGNFKDNPGFTPVSGPGRRISLYPKEKSIARFVKKIELNFSEKPGIMDYVSIYESKDSYTKLIFKNAVINQKLKESIFKKIQ